MDKRINLIYTGNEKEKGHYTLDDKQAAKDLVKTDGWAYYDADDKKRVDGEEAEEPFFVRSL